jgi:hypothetical protein
MITDNQLYSLAIFLGAAAMLMIVLYHFLEVNSQNDEGLDNGKTGVEAGKPLPSQPPQHAHS